MKLYKFRSLADYQGFQQVEQILTTEKFWCSRFWDLNDPMEGVFLMNAKHAPPALWEDVFSEKSKHLICSFSGKKALTQPPMWGYYAGGFKGVAIEVEVDPHVRDRIHRIGYKKGVVDFQKGINGRNKATIIEILRRKLDAWVQEDEYRFLSTGKEEAQRVGKLRGVYFGRPYAGIHNYGDVLQKSTGLRDYLKRAEELLRVAEEREIQTYAASIKDGRQVQFELVDSRTFLGTPS